LFVGAKVRFFYETCYDFAEKRIILGISPTVQPPPEIL
jgi:hypothetical protein